MCIYIYMCVCQMDIYVVCVCNSVCIYIYTLYNIYMCVCVYLGQILFQAFANVCKRFLSPASWIED